MTVFSKPCDPQAASRLVQLPAELVLNVIRFLLHFPDILYHEKHFLSKRAVKYHEAKVKAGCRLMQTCQILQRECQQVLFHENTIRLHFQVLHKSPCNYRACQARFRYLNQDIIINIPKQSLCEEDQGSKDEFKSFDVKWRRSDDKTASELSVRALSKFSRISIDLKGQQLIDGVESVLFWVGRTFQTTLKNKHLTFLVDGRIDPRDLLGCKILHCQSVKVVGCEPVPNLEDYMKRVLPVQDTYKRLNRFIDNFVDQLPEIRSNDFRNHHSQTIQKLRDHAFYYNETKFLKYERIVIDLAKTWMRHWQIHQKANAKGMIRLLEKRIEGVQTVYEGIQRTSLETEKLLEAQAWRSTPLDLCTEPFWEDMEYDDLLDDMDDEPVELPDADGGNDMDADSGDEE